MTSHAKSISNTPIDASSPSRDFEAATPEPRSSEMVAKDRPHPAPRPSLEISGDVDRATFDAAWDREQRRAAFIRERTEPDTDGRIRVLNREFNR